MERGGKEVEGKEKKRGRKEKTCNSNNSKDNQSLTAGCRELFSHFVPCSTTFPLCQWDSTLEEFWEVHQKLKNNSAIFNIKRISIANKTQEWDNLAFLYKIM